VGLPKLAKSITLDDYSKRQAAFAPKPGPVKASGPGSDDELPSLAKTMTFMPGASTKPTESITTSKTKDTTEEIKVP
jgi:hypothetical protein